MASVTISLDSGALADAVAEFRRLWGDGTGLPSTLRARAERMLVARGEDFIALHGRSGGFVAEPGPEFLAVLATLRALRGGC